MRTAALFTGAALATVLSWVVSPLLARASDAGAAAPSAVAAPVFAPAFALDRPPRSRDLGVLFDFVGVGDDEIWLASKTQTSLADAPAIVAVITQEDIDRWGFVSLADALKMVPGYYLVDDHVTVNVALRGVSGGEFAPSNLVKVLINNWSSDSLRSTGANWLGAEWVPMTAIKRVEMVRGPTSALFGSDAFLGAFNLVSKTGDDFAQERSVWKLTLGGGLVGSNPRGFDIDTTVGGRVGNVELMLGARFVGDDRSGMNLPSTSPRPQIAPYVANDTVASGLARQSAAVLGNVRYHFSETTMLELTPHFSFINRVDEFATLVQLTEGVDGAGIQRGTQVQEAKGILGLHLASELYDKVMFDAAATGFWGATLPGDRIDTGSIFFARRQYDYRGVDANAEVRWDGLPFLGLRTGLEFNLDFENLAAVTTVLADPTASAPAGAVVAGLSTPHRSGGFRNVGWVAEATYRPWFVPTTLVASFRYDNHSLYGNQLNGRVALVTHFLPNLDVKLLFGTAFKAPSPFLLYASPVRVGDVIGNVDLQPQRVKTVEAEVRYKPIKEVEASLVASGSQLTSLATFSAEGINSIALNVGSTDVLSIEGSIKAHLEQQLFAYVTGTYTLGARVSGRIGYIERLLGSGLEAFPSGLATAGAGYDWLRWHLRCTADVSYVGSQRPSDSNIIAGAKIYSLPAYALLGLQVALHDVVTDVGLVTARLAASNLIGTEAAAPGYGGVDYPLLPRSLYLYVSLIP